MPTIADVKADFPELKDRSDDEVVDAVHKAFYSDLPREQVAKAFGVKVAPPPEKAATWGDRAKDVGVSLMQGGVGAVQGAVGLADLATGGHTGKWLDEHGVDLNSANEYWADKLSDTAKAEDKAIGTAYEGEEGDDKGLMARIGRGAVATVQRPQAIVRSVAQSIPSMAAGGMIGRGALAVAPKLGAFATGLGEGVVTAGQQAEQIRTDEANPSHTLNADQVALAAGSGAVTGLIGAYSNRLAKAMGFETAENLMTGIKADKVDARGVVKRVLGGAVTEGFLEELPQSVQEQVAQNIATGQPLDKGVDQQAVMGALSGAAMGAGAQVFHGEQKQKGAGDVIREDKQPGGGPLATAVNAGIETAAQQADAAAPPPGTPPPAATPRETTADTIAAIRQLSPEDQQQALALQALGNREDVTPEVRSYAQERLDGMLGAAHQEEEAGAPLEAAVEGQKKPIDAAPAVAEVAAPKKGDTNDAALAAEEARLREEEAKAAFEQRNQDKPDEPQGEPQAGDILAKYTGAPFKTMRAAMSVQAQHPGSELVTVKGGIVVRPKAEDGELVKPAAAGSDTPAADTAPAADGGTERASRDERAAPADVGGAVERPADAQPAGVAGSAEGPPAVTAEQVDAAAHEAAPSPQNDRPEPTDAQKEAGNYKKGHITVHGIGVSVENPKGSVRTGKRPDGTTWSHKMSDHYGYIKRTEGADGEHIDVYIGPHPESDKVYVVDQLHQSDGSFDEHKALFGYATQAAAVRAYKSNFDPGWKVGPVTPASIDRFKGWLADGDTKQPFREAMGFKDAPKATEKAPAAEAPKPAETPAAEPTVKPAAPEATDAADMGARWTRSTPNERHGLLTAAGWLGGPNQDRIAAQPWDKIKPSQQARIAAGRTAEAASTVPTPPPKPGFVRFYHGGSPESVTGKLWFTSDLRDARGWASRDPQMRVWFVDVKKGTEGVDWGDAANGMPMRSRHELSADLASARKPLIEATESAPAAAAPEKKPATPQVPSTITTPLGAPKETALERRARLQGEEAVKLAARWDNATEAGRRSIGQNAGLRLATDEEKQAAKMTWTELPPKWREKVNVVLRSYEESKAEQDQRAGAALAVPGIRPTGEEQAAGDAASRNWYEKELTPAGRRKALVAVGATESEAVRWHYLGADLIGKLEALRASGWDGDAKPNLDSEEARAARLKEAQDALAGTKMGNPLTGAAPAPAPAWKIVPAPRDGRWFVETDGGQRVAEFGLNSTNPSRIAAVQHFNDSAQTRELAEETAAKWARDRTAAAPTKGKLIPYRREDGSTGYRTEAVEEPAPAPAAPKVSANTVFTEDAYLAARAILKKKLGNINSGLDPELLQAGIVTAGYHVEKGARTFLAFSKAMLADLGEAIRPYLKSWYLATKFDARSAEFSKDMTDAGQVERFDLDDLGTADEIRADSGSQEEPEPADTSPKEASHDSTPASGPTPLDHPVSDGHESVATGQPARGAQPASAGDGRADDGGVRRGRKQARVRRDAAADVGYGQGAESAPNAASGSVADGSGKVPAAKGRDFRPEPGGLKREGSWHETARRNLDLIDLARKVETEGRLATPEEQAQLAKYVGFGAGEIRNKIFPVPPAYEQREHPDKLIWPEYVGDARWKALAERAAALPIEWQRSILQSTQYAHYTSEGIIRSTWAAMQRFGFTGGKVLEPGMGIGSFSMLMPAAVKATSKYTGIEFDAPTALIARLLSPQQNMLHADFIKQQLPHDYFDVAIGNPPFSATRVQADPEYEKRGFLLHDYFFAKSMDRVRPGGLLAFVTSHGTMDKVSDKARKYLADRADLIGAIRLPQTAFEDNAGTKVVTDVIFLRKRKEGEAPAGEAWGNAKTISTKDGNAVVNEYFAAHPEMVLGEQRLSGNYDDKNRRISGLRSDNEYTVISYDDAPEALEEKFAAAVQQLPQNLYSSLSQDAAQVRRETAKADFDPRVKREGVVYLDDDGTLMRVESGVGRELGGTIKLSDKDKAWLTSYVKTRDAVNLARLAQINDGEWEKALKDLNDAYDAHLRAHGPIMAYRTVTRTSTDEDGNEVQTTNRYPINKRLFREDYDSSLLTSLERITEDGSIVKGPFLLGRTIGKPEAPQIRTVGDALGVSLDNVGSLDLDDVARRAGVTRQETIEALGDAVYQSPQGDWQLADEYLSGDVRKKLEEAEQAARDDPALERNVVALKKVQPDPLGPSQISVKLGTSWVDPKYVTAFAEEIGAGAVRFDPKTESWQVEGGNERTGRRAGLEFGTAARSPSELLEAALNSKTVVIKKTVDKKESTDEEATTAAVEALKKIKDKFKSWVWQDSERAADLVDTYNRRFNNIAPRSFNGDYLTLPGVSMRYELHPHQKRAIARQIQTGDTYLAHAVGAGKTIEMIAGGMEQKRLGLIKKPMYAVPNHMLEQFANEFMELYPLANIMVADDENFHTDRRRAFIAAATLNAPDAIIITHSGFERIGVKEESVKPIKAEILDELQGALDETGKGDRVRRSQLQQQIEAVEQRFDRIVGSNTKDSTIKFEDIGADFLYVDEAHAFRKLDFSTNQKIKGIDPSGSRRSLDMYIKTQYLESQRPGRAFAFASGTPVTNTMGELYTIMRFFAGKELDRTGTATFDAWARQYGEAVSALEANAAGRYETVERFAKFDNVPELMARVRTFMDVLNSEHLGAIVKRPDLEGGRPNLVTVEPTPDLKSYMKTVLLPRLEASRAWKPSPNQPFNPDPVIAITSDGRFAALDPRFFGASIDEDKTPTKLTAMADRVAEKFHATAGNEYMDGDKPAAIKGSTQLVFYNLGFGEGAKTNRGFDARAALVRRLTSKGVPRGQILFFDDADTDAKKEAMFRKMRSGEARILVGSAKKMGTGVNVQSRLAALHYFDPPWFPADVEQPHGRIIRQGNQNPVVSIDWYATKGTYDSTMWQMVARKQRFIDQAFAGDKSLRTMEDMSEASAYEQAAALASGDPRALQLAGLRQDVDRLERSQAAHANEQISVRTALRDNEYAIRSWTQRVAKLEGAFKAIGERYFTWTGGTVGGATFEKQGEFGQALKDAFNKGAAAVVVDPKLKVQDLGEVGPIKLTLETHFHDGKPTGAFDLNASIGDEDVVIITGSGLGADVDTVGLARRVVNAANGIDGHLRAARTRLEQEKTDQVRLRKKSGAPFEHAQALVEKYGELKTLEDELRAEGEADTKAAAAARLAQAQQAPAVNADGETPDEEAPAALRSDAPLADSVRNMRRHEVTAVAESIVSGWANKPKLVVVRDMTDPAVPEAVRALDKEQTAGGATGMPQGFYHGGSVYIVSDALRGPEDVPKVLMHEGLGHFGLRALYGRELGTILDRLAVLNAGKVRTKARQYGLDFDKQSDRRQAAEEVLADMAATQPQLGWVRSTIAAVRSWMREHVPGYVSMRLSDDEIIRDYILPARRHVLEGGRPAIVQRRVEPAFARTDGAEAAEDKAAFARSVAGVLTDVRDAKLPAGYIVSDLFNSSGKLHWWHSTIGTQFNLAQRSPQFRRVYDAVQRFLNDTSSYAHDQASLASTMLPRLDKWRDIGKSPLSAADTKAIAAPIFEGTLSWTRDAAGNPVRMEDVLRAADAMTSEEKARALFKAGKVSEAELKRWQASPLDIYDGAVRNRYEQNFLRAGVVWTDDELRTRFKATEQQVKLYHEFRAATDRSLSDLALSEMLRLGGKDVPEAMRQQLLAKKGEHDASAIALRDFLWEQAAQDPLRAKVLEDAADKIVKVSDHTNDLQRRGYAPLSRYGQFSLDVVDENGDRVYFGLFETARERARMARQMQANYPKASITQGTVSQEAYRVFAGVSPETIELFGNLLGLDSTGDDAKDRAFQQAIKLTQSTRSAMRRLLHRKGIAGFSEDAGRVLAGFIVSNSRRTSSNLHMGEMDAAVTDIPKTEGQLTDAAVRLTQYVKNPAEEAAGIRGLLFAQYLGGSVASALVNATQPFAVTFPWLSQFGGVRAAGKQMAAASRDAAAFAKTQTTGDKALDKAMNESPLVSPQEIHQLMGQAAGRGHLVSGDGTRAGDAAAKVRNTFSKLTVAWGKVFSVAEQFNRRITFIAAYRTAVAQGMSDPAAFANRAIAETQFVYNKGNKPAWARGAIGATLFTFKQYTVNYLELLNRMWRSGPEGKKAALLALGVLFLMGGADGLPFDQNVEDLIDGFMQHMGYNFQTRRARREFFAQYFGESGAQFIEKGVSGLPGVPIDVSGRFSLGNPIPGTGLALKKADHTQDVAQLLGPVGDLGKRAGQAVGKVLDRDFAGAADLMQATATRNIVKGIDMLKHGEYRDDRGRKVVDTSTAEGFLKMIGFQPNSVARVQEATSQVVQMVQLTKLVQSEVADKMAKAMYEHNSDAMAEARAMRDRWNDNNADMRIKIDMTSVLRRLKDMRSSKEERVAKTAPKAIRQSVREALTAQTGT